MIKRKTKPVNRRKTMPVNKRKTNTVVEEIVFPKPEVWSTIAHDLKLDEIQLNDLQVAIGHVVQNIAHYGSKKRQEPPRALQVTRLKRMERALGELQREIDRSNHLIDRFLPRATLEYISQSFTLSVIENALREKVPLSPNPSAARMVAEARGKPIDTAAMDESRLRALGFKHGGQILKHFIDAIHAPLKEWVELDRLNKGGRPPPLARTYLIDCLAREAPDIIGKPATISTTGWFVDLCALLLPACGLSARGVEKAIPPIVRRVRAEQRGKLLKRGAS